jgi:hypothetical protein
MVKSVAQDMNLSFSNPGFQAELYKMLPQDEGAMLKVYKSKLPKFYHRDSC